MKFLAGSAGCSPAYMDSQYAEIPSIGIIALVVVADAAVTDDGWYD